MITFSCRRPHPTRRVAQCGWRSTLSSLCAASVWAARLGTGSPEFQFSPLRILFTVFVALCLCLDTAKAQATSTLQGRIVDPEGAVVPSAKINLHNWLVVAGTPRNVEARVIRCGWHCLARRWDSRHATAPSPVRRNSGDRIQRPWHGGYRKSTRKERAQR